MFEISVKGPVEGQQWLRVEGFRVKGVQVWNCAFLNAGAYMVHGYRKF